jgi:hypothetical protein
VAITEVLAANVLGGMRQGMYGSILTIIAVPTAKPITVTAAGIGGQVAQSIVMVTV